MVTDSFPFPELSGKTISEVFIAKDESGGESVVLKFLDNTSFEVVGWQNEGYSLEMDIQQIMA